MELKIASSTYKIGFIIISIFIVIWVLPLTFNYFKYQGRADLINQSPSFTTGIITDINHYYRGPTVYYTFQNGDETIKTNNYYHPDGPFFQTFPNDENPVGDSIVVAFNRNDPETSMIVRLSSIPNHNKILDLSKFKIVKWEFFSGSTVEF